MTIVIDASGKLDLVGLNNGGLFSGPIVMAGDQMSGTLTPRAKGHVYDFILTDPPQPSFVGPTYTGIALFDPATNQLSLLAVDHDHRAIFIHRSTKQ